MDYILETKAFYDKLEVEQLPTSAIVLWHALMHMANKTGWKENFTVGIVVLEIKTGLKTKTIQNARTILQNKGFISFTSRGSNRSASYKINSLLINFKDCSVGFKEPHYYPQNDPQNCLQNDPQNDPHEGSINKQYNTKQNNINNTPLPPLQGKGKKGTKISKEKLNEIWMGYKAVYSKDLQEIVFQWLKYKQEKRQGYTEQGLNSLLKQIQKKSQEFGSTAVVNTIEESMASNYQGIAWNKLTKQGGYANGKFGGNTGSTGSNQSTGSLHTEESESDRLKKLTEQYESDDTDCEY